MFRVDVSSEARREMEKLPASLVERLIKKIGTLAANPRPTGCKKLHGEKDKWRIRVGDYRVLYFIFDSTKEVKVAAILKRSEAYR
jgi:mRNA interferase RelE/StbE